jgi:hypothetical protein
VLAIEAQKHPLGTADHRLLSQELVVHTAGVIGGVEVTREVLAKGSEGERRVLRAPASGGQQVIDGDPVDPGRQAGVAAEGAQARGDLDEDLLVASSASCGCHSIRWAIRRTSSTTARRSCSSAR